MWAKKHLSNSFGDRSNLDTYSEDRTFSQSASPQVMAYIGEDDPNRGDSKAAVGLAYHVAEMLNGHYVYVGQQELEKHFPHFKFSKDTIAKSNFKANDFPDIAIGTDLVHIPNFDRIPLTIMEFNDLLSSQRTNASGLVSHHLTDDLLEREARKLNCRYEGHIRGELIGVLMGCKTLDTEDAGKRLAKICRNHDEVTVFVCPSRRTEESKDEFLDGFAQQLEEFDKDIRGKINLLWVNYEDALEDYNPYLGILGRAEHLCVVGSSGSILSEALYAGKTVFTNRSDDYLLADSIRKEGHTHRIENLSEDQPLPTKSMPKLDVTKDVALSIAHEYLGTLNEREQSKIMCPIP